MIGEILEAFTGEMRALFDSQTSDILKGATVLKDTQFKPEQMSVYTMPLIIISLTDSPDMQQLPGGATQAEWGWNIKAYFYDINSALTPDDSFSSEAWNIIDVIRKHFVFQRWITQDYKDLVVNYGYKITLNGTTKADSIQMSGGVIPGFTINFDSIGIDTSTMFTTYSTNTLQTVNEIPFDAKLTASPTTISMAKTLGTSTFAIVSNTVWVITINQIWLTANVLYGFGNATITLTATANTTGITRTATATIEAENCTDVIITINQLGV
jgi:hypothetical protein